MPYGIVNIKRTTGNVKQVWKEGTSLPREVNPYTVAGQYFMNGKPYTSRSGTNAPKLAVKNNVVKRLPDGPWVWKLVTSRTGKRLAYKTFSKRLQKNVWAREPVKVLKLVQTWKKPPPKNRKGLNLAPNALSFAYSNCNSYGDDITVISANGALSNPNTKSLTVTGCLWTPFLPYGANSVSGANATNYCSQSISSIFAGYVTKADNVAIARLYERVKNQQVNLGQALIERAQTAKLLVDVAKRLVGFLRHARSGNLVKALETVLPKSGKQMANTHLAFQYGVLPLLSDIEGIAKALADKQDVEFDIVVRRKEVVPRTLLFLNQVTSGVLTFKDEVYSFGYVEVKYKYRFKISSQKMQGIRDLAQLGLSNLNALAWESIPFSFVYDWFQPIGDFLNNADAFDGLTVLHSTKTVFQKEYCTFVRTYGGSVGGYTTTSGTTGFVNEKVSCVRTLISAPPTLRIPEFKDPVSKMHIANALALFVSLRK